MSLTNDAVVRALLTTWQRRIHETATGLAAPLIDSVADQEPSETP